MGATILRRLGFLSVALMPLAPAFGATAEREAAGTLPDGSVIEAVTLTGANRVSARIISFGATLQSLIAPDRDGKLADVLLGFDDAADYAAQRSYFGVTVGRYANRIAGGRFSLDGKSHRVSQNDKGNALHGGAAGFDTRHWRIVAVTQGVRASVTLALTSEDGDQGYPGKVEAQVTYTLDDAGALTISFDATTDRPTVINITNHAVFNLAGQGARGSALSHRLTIPANAITPVTAQMIPTGTLRPVAGTPFDFRVARTLDAGIRHGRDPQIAYARGYDHNFALDKGLTRSPELAARLEDPVSGRVLEVLTSEPGLQLYTSNFLDGTVIGKGGQLYRMGDGVALEPQKFPDAPNRPQFASARVDPAQPYRHVMVYRLSVAR